MKKIRNWLRAWYVTLSIRYREPDLYRRLCEPLDGEDFGEVPEPWGE